MLWPLSVRIFTVCRPSPSLQPPLTRFPPVSPSIRVSRNSRDQNSCEKKQGSSWDKPIIRIKTERIMEDSSLLNKIMLNLRSTCKYYTGYPKDLGPPKVLHFTSEREFVQLLHQGHPVVVAFTIKCNLTKRLDKVLEEAAAEFDPHVKFLRVECPKYPGFCITRQKTEYPFIEIYHNPQQANEGKVVDPNITKYAVRVLPFHFDVSVYGFREFFKRHGIKSSCPNE